MRKIESNEYKKIVLNILVTIDKICRQNNLRYYLISGTLIGAVRHNGFIPWDDDVDIAMLRSDFNKLMDIISSGDYGLNFISIDNSEDTIYSYGKICDSNTVMDEIGFADVKGYGAFVDVFPLDYMPEDDQMAYAHFKKCRRMMIMITHSSRTCVEKCDDLGQNILKVGAFVISRFINTQKLIKKYDATVKSVPKSRYYGVAWFKPMFRIDEKRLEHPKDIMFEGHKLMTFEDHDYFLNHFYGNYMQLPPVEQRVNKHALNCYYNDRTSQ